MRSLLLGAGNSREKKIIVNGCSEWAGELTTLDMNPDCGADFVWDLENRPLPFDDGTFDELAAYDVLEHLGGQGDWKGFFDEFAEYWRILKPGGLFGIIVPVGQDALADPGHTRFFSASYFGFLNQENYAARLAAGEPVTDYRWYWKRNFEIVFLQAAGNHHVGAMLKKKE